MSLTNGKAAYYELPPAAVNTPGDVTRQWDSSDRVLFIHGVQTPAIGLLPLAKALHDAFPSTHCVLLELWGHGLTDAPVTPYEADLFHQLIDAMLNELKWPSAHLVGFSFGASLSTGYATSRTALVESMTLVAPAGLIRLTDFTPEEQVYLGRGADEAAAQAWILDMLEEGGKLIVPDDWQERVTRGEVVAEAVREWQLRKHPGHAASVVAVLRDAGAIGNHAAFASAAGTGIPSLAVLGKRDGLSSEKELNQLGFKNVDVIPGAGHGVVRERVPEVANAISRFWVDQCNFNMAHT